VNLDGIFLPVTTPFDPATGDPDLGAFADNIHAWCAHPIAGVVVGGSTGEQALLDEDELLALVARAARSRSDGMALIAGTGAESTRATIRLCELAAREGADAVLVKPPAYYRGRMSPEAIRTYFLAVADASPVPVILYHVPKFVPVEIVPELAGDLVQHDNVAGIKDSSADIHNLGALCESVGERGTVVGHHRGRPAGDRRFVRAVPDVHGGPIGRSGPTPGADRTVAQEGGGRHGSAGRQARPRLAWTRGWSAPPSTPSAHRP
jgi:4-hydroxy-2-oxoglutarate aldolase